MLLFDSKRIAQLHNVHRFYDAHFLFIFLNSNFNLY
jgi:hypothetical protein